MTTLEQIPATLDTIIKTVDLFSSPQAQPHVLMDDGTINAKMEDSLNTAGWCVVISPLLITTKFQKTAAASSQNDSGTALLHAVTVIVIRTNPKVNKTGNPLAINLLQAVRKIIKAALSWKPANGELGFELVADATADPDFQDVGNFTYHLRLLKPTHVA